MRWPWQRPFEKYRQERQARRKLKKRIAAIMRERAHQAKLEARHHGGTRLIIRRRRMFDRAAMGVSRRSASRFIRRGLGQVLRQRRRQLES